MSETPEHWDAEIARIEEKAGEIFRVIRAASIGVAVDDARKQAYFVPRLQRMINKHGWAGAFCVIALGVPPIEVRMKENG